MKFTAQEEYGLRCILQVAQGDKLTPVRVPDIAQAEGLSVPYVEKLLRILSKAGLCESVRGVNGGFRLSQPLETVSLGDVMRALGGLPEMDEHCSKRAGEYAECAHSRHCGVRSVWNHVALYLNHLFDSIPLAGLIPITGECLDLDLSVPLKNEKTIISLPISSIKSQRRSKS